MNGSEWIYIWPVEGGEPMRGMFAVRFGRGHLDRALLVSRLATGIWEVYVDGELHGARSIHWHEAFGTIWSTSESKVLLGRRITIKEYEKIIRLRLQDTSEGVNVSKAVDINQIRPRF